MARISLVATVVAALAVAAVAGLASLNASARPASGTISLVAYSTPQQVYEDSLEPGFKDTSNGKDVDFSNSFGSSGDQSRARATAQSRRYNDRDALARRKECRIGIDGLRADAWNGRRANDVAENHADDRGPAPDVYHGAKSY